MATTKTFNNVRLQLKYDTYSAWTTANPTLLAGEIAITTVPTKGQDGVQQVPAVLMKVGDGSTPYNDLQFVSGLAANVHDWAMAATKPEYKASEIKELADFINTEIQDTNTTYQIVKVDDYTYKLQYKELDGAWTDVAENGSVVIPKYDDTQVKADIAALQTQIGEGKVEEQIANAIAGLDLPNTYDAKGAAAEALTQAKAYVDALNAEGGAVAENAAAIESIRDGETIDSFADVEAELEAVSSAASEAAQKAYDDAKDYADGKDAAIQAAQGAANAAQGEIDALEQVVGTPTEGQTVVGMIDAVQGNVDALDDKIGDTGEKTVVEMIAEAQTAATYDDTQVKADIAANAKAIADNKTDIEGKLDSAKADLEKAIEQNATAIETLTNGVDAEKIDGVTDLINYVETHGPEVLEIQANIQTNADDIDAVEGRATNLEGRMDAAEADIDQLQKDVADVHKHTNLELLETYTQTEANLADAVAKKHDHGNKAVLDGITAEKVTAWDGAVTKSDALEATMGEVEEGKTLVEMIEAAKDAAVESATYDDTEVRGLIKTNADDIDALEERATALETNAVLEGDTLILNCGTSAIA